jgi:hypothetical protein
MNRRLITKDAYWGSENEVRNPRQLPNGRKRRLPVVEEKILMQQTLKTAELKASSGHFKVFWGHNHRPGGRGPAFQGVRVVSFRRGRRRVESNSGFRKVQRGAHNLLNCVNRTNSGN